MGMVEEYVFLLIFLYHAHLLLMMLPFRIVKQLQMYHQHLQLDMVEGYSWEDDKIIIHQQM